MASETPNQAVFDIIVKAAEDDGHMKKHTFPATMHVGESFWGEIRTFIGGDRKRKVNFTKGLILYCRHRHEMDMEVLGANTNTCIDYVAIQLNMILS